MARTNTNSSTNKSSSGRTSPPSQDAVSMLTSEHREVERAFDEFESHDGSKAQKKKLADKICQLLEQHMAIEEKIFYPTLKKEMKESEDLVNEAIVEHSSAKDLMKQIRGMKGDEELFDSKVLVLKELIEHHVEEEEEDMFSKAKESSLDLDALGEKMAEMKHQM
jgi:hemerythrin-like domain-containing protein